MTKRFVRPLAAALVGAGLLATAPSATAATTGSAYSAAIYGSAGSLSVSATGTGLVGSTLAATLAPLVSVLNSVAGSLAGSLVTGITGAGYVANSPASAQAPPTSGYPANCASGGWTFKDCYSATNGPTIAAGGAATLSLNALQGYATGDSTGYYASAQVAGPTLSVLGITVGNLGVVSSTSSCSAAGACVAASSVSGTSLFGGAIRLQTASGGTGLLQYSLDGGATWKNVNSITAPVSVSGIGVTLTADGSLLHAKISLSLGALLSTLGLGGLLTSLTGLDPGGTSLALTVTVGSGRSTTSGSTGWGLSVGLDLAGTVAITQSSLLSGLLGSASISIPSGITNDPGVLGNIATLQLGYTAATAGTTVSSGPTWYPAGLI